MMSAPAFTTRLGLFVALLLSAACEDGVGETTNADAGVRQSDGHEHDMVLPPQVVDAGGPAADGGGHQAYDWKLPKGFPRPRVPEDNPMTQEKVELGRHIFYDKRLSDNQTFSCASCHKQALAFADERGVGFGSTGETHPRGPMSLANIAYSPTVTWANPTLTSLEKQALVPIFGDDPIELGMMSTDEVESRFRAVPRYQELFSEAFPDEAEPITLGNLIKAVSAFQRTLLSGTSAYDRYINGVDPNALSESAHRGMTFVTSNEDHRFECNHCHGGFNFSDHVMWDGLQTEQKPLYHQTGLYNTDGNGGYPEPNTGVYDISLVKEDMGKFKVPTLRNVAITPPYMHDGSIATLSEVLDHYAKGGRARSRHTDGLIRPFEITEQDKADIIAFLESLTDEEFISDPRFADPWPADPAVNAP